MIRKKKKPKVYKNGYISDRVSVMTKMSKNTYYPLIVNFHEMNDQNPVLIWV